MDTKQVIGRFEAERQALAMMDHPNIARIFDGGETDSGRPYFVMELVQGIPITDFCDTNKLSTRRRLDLFLPVCLAIQSAHQKGIIHRDIKPNNVLVTLDAGDPVPVVIDFGVAKATNQRLSEKTFFTQFGMMIGTPAYMSPEQAEMSNVDIDTRADVYALGVLLYELLTGTTPFSNDDLRNAAWQDMIRIITERDPEKPSSRVNTLGKNSDVTPKKGSTAASDRSTQFPVLKKLINGDLDWITMKCLEKDRSRRYSTPNELAADIGRFMGQEPVLAAAPSTLYRLKKLYARNRVKVVAGIVVIATLLVATAFSAHSAGVARSNELAARKSAEAAMLAKEKEVDARLDVEKLAESQRLQIYALDMYRAGQFTKEGSRKAAHDLLEKQIPKTGERDLRGFEWEYLKSRLTQSDQCLGTLEGGTDEITASPGGKFIAYEDDQRETVVIREQLAPFRIVKELPNPGVVIEFSHADRLLVVATGQHGVRIYETESWTEIKRWSNWTYPALFSPDGTLFACKKHDDPRLFVYSTETWQEEFSIELGELGLGWWLRRHSVAFSPNGHYLIYPARRQSNEGVRAYSFYDISQRTDDAKLSGTIPYSLTVSMSPDGRTLAADDPEIRRKIDVWDLTGEQPKKVRELRQHRYTVSRVRYSPDGRYLVSIGGDEQVAIWDAKTHEHSHSLWGHLDQLWALAISPDSQTLFTGSSRAHSSIKVWDIQPPAETQPTTGFIVGVAGDRQELVTCDLASKVRLWNREGQYRDIAAIADSPYEIGAAHDIPAWTITSDGKTLVVGYKNGQLRTWNIESGKELRSGIVVQGHEVYSLCAHATRPDAIAVCTLNTTRDTQGNRQDVCRTFLWDIADQKAIRELPTHQKEVVRLAMSPTGEYLAVNLFTVCQVYSLHTDEKLFEYHGKRPMWAVPVFSPDGTKLAVAEGRVIRIFESMTGKQKTELHGHAMSVFALGFSPDGNTLVSSNDSVKLWHLPTQTDVITLPGDGTLLTKIASNKYSHRLFISSGMFARKVETFEIPIVLKRED